MDADAFDLQEIKKRVGQFFLCFDNCCSLILAADNVIKVSSVIINGNLEMGSSYGLQ